MLLDAIVLAGGKSSRLSGTPKSALLWRGSTLLQNTLNAVLDAGARRVVVVGPGSAGSVGTATNVLFAREDPPFGGPAAAVAAGLDALDVPGTEPDVEPGAEPDAVLVLACDMPGVSGALAALVEALPVLVGAAGRHGAIMLDPSGVRQPLAAVYGRSALADAIGGLRASNTLDGASMRSLISSLDLLELADADGSTHDVDTWSDAAAFGIERPDSTAHALREGVTMSDGDTTAKPARTEAENAEMLETLEQWSASLAAELGIVDVDVDIDALLALAGVAAHAVLRPAAPLTTYLVGYAAGRAAALGVNASDATARAADTAAELARRRTA
jgi:molybdopterin-guanine dinucleotide biosynthesis protein A